MPDVSEEPPAAGGQGGGGGEGQPGLRGEGLTQPRDADLFRSSIDRAFAETGSTGATIT